MPLRDVERGKGSYAESDGWTMALMQGEGLIVGGEGTSGASLIAV